ncbi:MAG: hypothetical protein WC608_05450 [Parcubacteria group bacterium]
MLKNILKNHWPIFILALVISLLVVRPTLFAIYQSGWKNFNGVYPILNDDEEHYLAMSKRLYDGRTLGNVYLKEHQNDLPLMPDLAEWLIAKEAKALRLTVPATFFLNDFILPFLGVVLLYLLFVRITAEKKIAAGFSVFFYLLFLFSFGRPINPQFSFIFLVLSIILIWEIFFKDLSGRRLVCYNIFLGATFGMLLYVYPYYWTAVLVLYIVSLLAGVVVKKSFETIKYSSVFFITALIFGLPYFRSLAALAKNPFYNESLSRLGLLNIHWPGCYFNVLLIALTGLALLLCRRLIGTKQEFYFSLALLLAAWGLNWQNIITGKYLQFSSHYYQVTVFFSFLVLAIIFKNLRAALKNNGWVGLNKTDWLAIVFALAFLALLVYKQKEHLKIGFINNLPAEQLAELQEGGKTFDWLNQNTLPDSVIYFLGSDSQSNLISIYTRNNLYAQGYGAAYLLSDDELEDRWARQNIFKDKVDGDFILADQRSIWLNKFIDRYQNQVVRNKIIQALTGKKTAEPILVPPEYVARVLNKYNEIKKEDPRTALKKYELDYILLDTNDDKYRGLQDILGRYSFIVPVAQIGSNLIYKVN